MANQERLQLQLENLLIELDEDEKSVTIFVTAKIPVGSEYLTFGWSQKFGDLVIRELGESEGLYSGYLSRGEISPKIALKVGERSSRVAQFFSYMLSGVYHIVPIGFDHILFIIGLYLVSIHLRSLIFQVSLFTFAHTITLGLASFEIINVSSAIVEVITLVKWSMLPPTMITAPTSDKPLARPANTTVSREYLASKI